MARGGPKTALDLAILCREGALRHSPGPGHPVPQMCTAPQRQPLLSAKCARRHNGSNFPEMCTAPQREPLLSSKCARRHNGSHVIKMCTALQREPPSELRPQSATPEVSCYHPNVRFTTTANEFMIRISTCARRLDGSPVHDANVRITTTATRFIIQNGTALRREPVLGLRKGAPGLQLASVKRACACRRTNSLKLHILLS